MRVLHLSLGYNSTGADRCARELFEKLPELGVETEMWIGEHGRQLPPGVSYLPRPWERFLFPLEAFPDLTDWRHRGSIAKLPTIRKDHFDLVHMHNIHSGWLSMKALKEFTRRFPCVWTLHDEWAPNRGVTCNLTGKMTASEVKRLSRGPLRYIPYHRYHENFKWRRTRTLLAEWMPQPKVVICPSAHMKSMAESSGAFPNSMLLQIPNGTNMTTVPNATMDRGEAKKSFGLSADSPVVLMVATNLADAHKGIDLGIKALKLVDPALGVQVLLLGRSAGEIQQALQPLRSVGAFARDDATLARAYRAADVTLIPSLAENFPNVGLESLACGTPLVAFPIGGIPEIIGNNERGRICRSIDVEEMARHIAELLSDDGAREEAGRKGSEWVTANCRMTLYLERIVKVYSEVLSQSVSPP